MRCAWQALLNLLPQWMRQTIDKESKDTLQEIRLRIGQPVLMITATQNILLQRAATRDDLNFCINAASRYSPWNAGSAQSGYLTAPGGHRIGLCGQYIQGNAAVVKLTSICIRVARDFPEIGKKAASLNSSILILGRPGSGKTTLLRDLIRERSNHGYTVCVVDEREEVFPVFDEGFCFPVGKNTDILTGCPKINGIEMALRNMTPQIIAVDEITAAEDCTALIKAGWCGVSLIATAHAGSKEDLYSRQVYRPIIESGIFQHLLILQQDKSYRTERMDK